MDSIAYIKQFPVVSFQKGEVLLSEGQPSTSLFAIQTGFVKMTSLDENGVENLLWIEGRYDTVPTEKFFSLRNTVQFYYTALSDGTYYDIDKKSFLDFARSSPDFMAEIAVSMSSHYDDLLLRINSTEQISVQKKLIFTLRHLAEKLSANSVVNFTEGGLRLTHSDFAAMVGSTRETISLELHKLKSTGSIYYDNSTFIVYLDKLKI